MLSAYVNASDMVGAEKFFKRIKQDGLRPNVVTFGTLIKGYAKTNNLEKMMEKYEEMQAYGVKLNQTILTTIMDAYGKNRDFGTAVVWYKEMESCGLPPDQKAKNILLSLATTREEQKEASQLVGHLDQSGNDLRLNGVSKFVDEDDEDEDNEDGDDVDKEYDVPEDAISYDEKQDELNHFTGDDQQNLEFLHTLKSIDL